jgi:hypothetical protein
MKVNLHSWEFTDKIEKIINQNCKEIPYEGTEIDKQSLKEDIIQFLEQNYHLQKRFSKTTKH